ncbi:MAG: hypothetical protein ACYTEQ_21700 [Planctomycetota bacterium]|jgi:late competence protein required for DNA uptake (superfamily II DNA/RNA helicase)
MLEVECIRCGRKVLEYEVWWLDEIPYCERCIRQARIDEEVNAQEANNEAQRKMTGKRW